MKKHPEYLSLSPFISEVGILQSDGRTMSTNGILTIKGASYIKGTLDDGFVFTIDNQEVKTLFLNGNKIKGFTDTAEIIFNQKKMDPFQEKLIIPGLHPTKKSAMALAFFDESADTTIVGMNHETRLFHAAQNNHADIVYRLIHIYQVNPQIICKVDIMDIIKLRTKQKLPASQDIDKLLHRKAITGEDEVSVTPFEIAQAMGNQEVIKIYENLRPIEYANKSNLSYL
jgi:hypothetical protein